MQEEDYWLTGMDPLRSPRIYPRIDDKWRRYGSLNFDLLRTKISREQVRQARDWVFTPLVHLLIAFIVAGMGLGIYFLQYFLSDVRTILFNEVFLGKMITYTTGYTYAYEPGTGWMILWVFGVGYVLVGAALTTYFAPHTARSGTPQLMA